MTERPPPLEPPLPLVRPLSALPLQSLSDDDLLARLSELLTHARRVETDLVAHIGEVDERRLYRREAAASMFAYCVDVLHLSEHEAYLRITVARAAREHPVLLDLLGRGRLHLSGIAKLVPILTAANRDSLLNRASGRSKREIEELVAELSPRPDAAATIRKLPERVPLVHRPDPLRPEPTSQAWALLPSTPSILTASADAASPPDDETPLRPDRVDAPHAGALHAGAIERPSSVEALAPDRYKVQFTASRAFRDKLDRLTALMRSTVPDGDLVRILEQAVSEKLERLEAKRFAKTRNPRTVAVAATADASRHIPAAVKRAVHDRDQGRCRFISALGQRCRARERLEFHHVHPWAHGGDRSVVNIRLMCRAHNALLAEHDYGPKRMATFRRVQPPGDGQSLEPP